MGLQPPRSNFDLHYDSDNPIYTFLFGSYFFLNDRKFKLEGLETQPRKSK